MNTAAAPDTLHLSPGDNLPAVRPGLRVLGYTPKRARESGTYAHGVVLVMDLHNDFHPFVVWTAIAREYGTIVESGDYCTSFVEAVAAYTARGGIA